MKTRNLLLCMAGLAALFLNAAAAWADTAGHIQFVNGDVQVVNASGMAHALKKGDAINEGDTISSAKDASAQVKMVDGGFIAVRQDTQLKFDSFKFSTRQGEPENSFFSLVKGSFRAVTGLIGRVNKRDYKITTPVATIGIRGTDHETAFVPNALPGIPAGAYSKVNVGETSLTTDVGSINVKPNQMGYARGMTHIPELLPINTNLFTVAVAPAKEPKVIGAKDKEERGGGQGGHGTRSVEPIRDTAVVDNTSEGAGIQASVPIAPAVTDTTTSTAITPPQTTIPVIATNDSLTLDTTNQTVSAGSGTPPLPVQNGTIGIDAQAAADAAASAAAAAKAAASAATANNTTLTGITQVSTAPATTAISTASTSIATATTAVTTAAALTPADAATAAANATAAQNAATAAAALAATAQSALTTHGTFADVTAGPANTATQNANASLQTASTTVQTAAGNVSTQNAALTSAQTAASTALTSANSTLTTANTNLTTANTQNAAIVSAQSTAATPLTAAQTAATNAQNAAAAAAAAAAQAATLQAAGDLTGAQAQLAIAQQQLAIAQTEQANALAAQTAVATQLANAQAAQTAAGAAVTTAANTASAAATDAATASTQASAAQTAANSAAAALATTGSQLAVVSSNATTVTANAPIAAYNNPAVAGNFVGHTMMPVPGASSGYNLGESPDNPPVANTTYVLDGSGNLVEARDISFQTSDLQSSIGITPRITNADIKWANGTASENFKLPDNSIYGGRWENPTVTVTDLSNSAVTTYTPKDSLWAVLLPPSVGYVQSLTGTTTYTMAAHTTPFDALGNLGTLNSATLSADFVNQWVDATVNLTMGAVSPMAGTFNVAGTHMPIESVTSINPSGFGSNVLTATCTGTCANSATGYSANIGGSFAGTAAASAGLGYSIWPTTSANTPVIDLVQGLVAFTADTIPATVAFAPIAANATSVAYTGAYGGSFSFIAAPGDVTPAGNPTTFTQRYGDISGYWTDVLNGASTATPPTTTTNGITFGVWETVSSVDVHEHHVIMSGQGGGAAHAYMFGAEGYLDSPVAFFDGTTGNTGPLVGTFSYNKVAMTSYDNNSNNWATGTALSATMSADFTHQTANVALAGTMGATSWTSTGSSMPITFLNSSNGTGASFNSSSPIVTVNTLACSTCGGNINGSFVGQNYAGAIVQYNVWDNNGLNVDGLVAFDRMPVGTNPTVVNSAPNPAMTTYVLANNSYNVERPTSIATDTVTGVLTGWGVGGFNSTVAPAAGSVAQTAVGTGSGTINWGEWATGSVADNTFSYVPGVAQLHWITAPEPTPVYLAEVLTTTATYHFVDGDVTSNGGIPGVWTSTPIHGTVNSTTSLSVNFATQSVAVNLDAAVNGHNWLASTTNAPLQYLNNDSLGSFNADSYRLPSAPGYLTVTVDAAPANGNLAGQLVGTALDGAFLKFNLDGQVINPGPTSGYEFVQGVAALGADVPNDPLTPYKIAVAMVNDPVVMNGGDPMRGGFQATANVGFDGSGNLIKFSDKSGMNATKIDISAGTSASAFTGISSSAGTPCSPCTDAVTGVAWGRWAPGVTATITEAGVSPQVVPINGGGVHWIATPELSGPTTLPVSGAYDYVVVGGTNPTDSTGAVGTLNSASLHADFTNQKVNVGVNATVGATTIDASASNVPISKNATFNADTSRGLAVACSGTACGASGTPQGEIRGGFGGAGAMGAVMMYGFLPNPAAQNIITGVVAFHR